MTAAYMSRFRTRASAGHYEIHQKVYQLEPSRPLYRFSGDHVLIVGKSEPVGIESKVYSPQVSEGERLNFIVKAEVSKSRSVKGKRGERFDPIMAERNESGRAYSEISLDVGRSWLERTGAKNGFALKELQRAEYEQIKFVKKGQRRNVRLTALDLEGLLEVTDADVFKQALVQGLGRGKAFGLGLLLVRRLSHGGDE